MQKKSFTSYFFVFFVFSLLLIGASKIGLLSPVDSFFKTILSPIQAIAYGTFSKVTGFGQNSEIQLLKSENLVLKNKLIDQDKLIGDNKALRDQFQTTDPKSVNLLPADVVGAPGFVPGLSLPEILILNKGANDGIKIGDAVVYQNNLVGKVTQVSGNLSNVILLTNSSSQFIAQTLETKAQGVIKGQGGGGVIFDNVLLSDNLKKEDLVLTKGDINAQGSGFPPNLVVGKIISVSKNPSDLFQKAEVKTLIDLSNLEKVFIVIN
jgi:rod shape-determining protein MreC